MTVVNTKNSGLYNKPLGKVSPPACTIIYRASSVNVALWNTIIMTWGGNSFHETGTEAGGVGGLPLHGKFHKNNYVNGVREAFQSKKQRNLGIHPKW